MSTGTGNQSRKHAVWSNVVYHLETLQLSLWASILNKLLKILEIYTDTYPKTGQVTATVGSCIRYSLYASPVADAGVEVNFLAPPVNLKIDLADEYEIDNIRVESFDVLRTECWTRPLK